MGDPLKRTLLILTFVTGILDAASFLGLGQVFVAMQTGNVIFLGLGIAGQGGAPTVAPLIALGAFLVGGLAAGMLPRAPRPDSAGALRLAMALEIALLGVAAILAALIDVHAGRASAYVLIALLSLAMGLRNTVARGIGDPNLATTVLNLTLSALVTHTPTGFASEGELALRGTAIAAILVGAIVGALLIQASLALAIAAAVAGVLVAALSGRGLAPARPALEES
jgi:uncharacterized membrane protein YoaK (UPF0700 family)